jgi:hypothetical protein
MLELQNEFPAECAAHSVKERAKPVAINIVLHVPRVEVIEQVKNAKSNTSFHLFVWNWNRYWPCHLHIEGIERAEAL